MKPVESNLIESFLWHVGRGLISGTPDNDGRPTSSGKARLEQMCQALIDILEGGEVDAALEIERKRAKISRYQQQESYIHELKKQKTPWKVVARKTGFEDHDYIKRKYNLRKKSLYDFEDLVRALNDSKM